MTKHGFPHDRRYMLLKVNDAAAQDYENMHVSHFPTMCLFTTALHMPSPADPSSASIKVTYTDPGTGATDDLSVPLVPDSSTLAPLPVTMHQSHTVARAMPASYAAWFSAHFGFDVVLAHLGQDSYRAVLGNVAPNAAVRNAKLRAQQQQQQQQATWFGALATRASAMLGGGGGGAGPDETADADADTSYEITFADLAPYLVVSQTSVDDAAGRLQDGVAADVTKFRPNIVVSGAAEAFDEDFWGELSIGGGGRGGAGVVPGKEQADDNGGITLLCTANCARCTSLNVDYATGTFASKEGMLKKLQRDRRVDPGTPYSPCFGRYAFMMSRGSREVRVGDAVAVRKRNDERSVFKYPGIGVVKKEDLYPL